MKATKWISYSVPSKKNGGLGLDAIQILKSSGIPAKRDPLGSCYVGDVPVMVDSRFEKKADKIIFNG